MFNRQATGPVIVSVWTGWTFAGILRLLPSICWSLSSAAICSWTIFCNSAMLAVCCWSLNNAASRSCWISRSLLEMDCLKSWSIYPVVFLNRRAGILLLSQHFLLSFHSNLPLNSAVSCPINSLVMLISFCSRPTSASCKCRADDSARPIASLW